MHNRTYQNTGEHTPHPGQLEGRKCACSPALCLILAVPHNTTNTTSPPPLRISVCSKSPSQLTAASGSRKKPQRAVVPTSPVVLFPTAPFPSYHTTSLFTHTHTRTPVVVVATFENNFDLPVRCGVVDCVCLQRRCRKGIPKHTTTSLTHTHTHTCNAHRAEKLSVLVKAKVALGCIFLHNTKKNNASKKDVRIHSHRYTNTHAPDLNTCAL